MLGQYGAGAKPRYTAHEKRVMASARRLAAQKWQAATPRERETIDAIRHALACPSCKTPDERTFFEAAFYEYLRAKRMAMPLPRGGKRRSAPQRARGGGTGAGAHRGAKRATGGKRRGHGVVVGAFPRGYKFTRPIDPYTRRHLWDVEAPNGEHVGDFELRREAVLAARAHARENGFIPENYIGKKRRSKGKRIATSPPSRLSALVGDINRLVK